MSSTLRTRAVAAAAAILGLTASAACRPRPDRAADTSQRAAGARTVFTDSALYRQVCAEADSGMTPASRRCTPRDQSRSPVRPPEPRRP
jgi:hypothetical protein